jgi:hypothetical protein
MISGEQMITVVWRCPDCASVYEVEGLLFVHTDEAHWYYPCGDHWSRTSSPRRSGIIAGW